MSDYEMKPNSGSAFRNTRRRGDRDPNLTGSALIDGKDYWVNVWLKKDKNGHGYISFSVNEKKPRTEEAAPPPTEEVLDLDGIPF